MLSFCISNSCHCFLCLFLYFCKLLLSIRNVYVSFVAISSLSLWVILIFKVLVVRDLSHFKDKLKKRQRTTYYVYRYVVVLKIGAFFYLKLLSSSGCIVVCMRIFFVQW